MERADDRTVGHEEARERRAGDERLLEVDDVELLVP
jgi:hypothetical protein